MFSRSLIRNFAIIAHIDHGKSTLADRLLEITGVVIKGDHEEQFLDRNPISRKRGITIKLAPVRMKYTYENHKLQFSIPNSQTNLKSQISKKLPVSLVNTEYILNLIDTPGHVDFSYEVDRTLSCVEGVVLLVDATQGIQAQTVANVYKAIEKNLAIIPVVNKIDLATAEVEKTKSQISEFLGIDKEEILLISAKTGLGVKELLNEIIEKVPSPRTEFIKKGENKSLIFDSYYDIHRGVVAFIRVFSGELKQGQKLFLSSSKTVFINHEVGVFKPELVKREVLREGEIGYLITNLKDIRQLQVGETILSDPANTPLPGYKKVKPMVFASIFPTDPDRYLNLKKAIEKLYLTDSAVEFSPVYSRALGSGFKMGFLGLLHADVIHERLEKEFDQNIVITPPKINFKQEGKQFFEPYAKITVITPKRFMGAVMALAKEKRAEFLTMDNRSQIIISYKMPLSEMVHGFFNELKGRTAGFASFDWQFDCYRPVKARSLTILINKEPVDEFSEIVVLERAYERAAELTKKLRESIPRQQFEVRIQADYGGKIIASERLAPLRKDVTAKLYGGDRTRKDKLLKKQKKGKKKLKMIGKVNIPKEAFLKIFRQY